MDDKIRFFSYSADYNKAVLAGLISKELFDTFFIFASDLASKVKGYEFEGYVHQTMKETGFPAFARWVDTALQTKGKTKQKLRREVLCKILNIAHNSSPITSDFAVILAEYLRNSLG